MTIDKINFYLAQVHQQQQQQQVSGSNQVSKTEGKSSSSKGIPAATDSVQLSTKSQTMEQLQKTAAASGQIRSQHIAELQNQIQNNSYPIHPEKIAAKMLQEIL